MTFSVSAPTNNTGALLNNGTEVLSVDSSNNVNVSNDLTVNGVQNIVSSGTYTKLEIKSTNTTDLALTDTNEDKSWVWSNRGNGNLALIYEYPTSTFQTRMQIDTNGYVTKPNQPAFSARLGTTISTPGASSDVVFDLIQTNVGNHYNTSNGQFTAPVAGIYRFHSILQFHNGSAQVYAGAGFQVNNTNITSGYTNQYTTNAHALWAGEFVTSLSQNDVVNVTYFGQAGTAPSIQGGNRSWFMGYLIG